MTGLTRFSGKGAAVLLWAIMTIFAAIPQASGRLDLRSAYLATDPSGRVSSCDVLKFVDRGETLLAAGDDKVVHSWSVGRESLTYSRSLRWNILRETRGMIYALATSPSSRLIAVGGAGLRTSDVVVFDRDKNGSIRHGLAATQGDYVEARSAVWAMAFDPAEKHVAIGQGDGSVWVWTLATGAASRVATPVDPKAAVTVTSRVVWVRFTDDGRAVRFARRDGVVSEVVPGLMPRELCRFGNAPINTADASPDGLSIAATPLEELREGSRVEVHSLAGARTRLLTFPRPARAECGSVPGATSVVNGW